MAQTTKIMLVEDDNNLGEIYMARMAAEGYSVVVAHDGEEALAMAAKEKPDLIISDVMMPKISGFEMLDILRNTPGLRDTKVIMLTALGQAEDKTRAQSLGADRYLVKSQVTLEDIVENARALLSGERAAGAAAAPAAAATVQPAVQPQAAAPVAPTAAAPAPQPPAVPVAVTPEPIPIAAPPGASAAEPVLPAAAVPPASVPTPLATAEPPSPIPAEGQHVSASIGGLAEPLNATPEEAKTEDKTIPIADIAKPTVPLPNPPAPPVSPTPIATTLAPAVPPAQPVVTSAASPQPVQQTPVTSASAAVTNEKVLAGAVDELLANTPQADNAAVAAVPAPAAAAAPPAENKKPDKGDEVDAGGNDISTGDNSSVRIANKKIIAPINDVAKKPDLNALLANEEAKSSGTEALPKGPGITTSTNGLQTTVVMPSGADILGVTTTPITSPPGSENATQEAAPPGSQNPNTAPPPSTSFDPNSVAL